MDASFSSPLLNPKQKIKHAPESKRPNLGPVLAVLVLIPCRPLHPIGISIIVCTNNTAAKKCDSHPLRWKSKSKSKMASSSSSPPAPDNNNKRTRLDRSIAVVLENPDETPSLLRDGISPLNERLHRFHGTSAIFESSRGLSLGPSTCATACTIFHRFYHSASLAEHDVWSVAMASTLLATKAEEDAKSLKQIVDEYARIYARRLVLADLADDNENDENNNNKRIDRVLASSHSACLDRSIVAHWATSEERRRFCATRLPRQLNKFGPVYKEWHKQITKMESILLRRLGFTFYWISDSHPHRFVRDFCRVLRLEGDREVCVCLCLFCVRACPECVLSCLVLSCLVLSCLVMSCAITLLLSLEKDVCNDTATLTRNTRKWVAIGAFSVSICISHTHTPHHTTHTSYSLNCVFLYS